MKNYIGFANDHSGSMQGMTTAALRDYNTNIGAVKDAATREMLDTIVSVVGFGVDGGFGIKRQIVNSNPHVLKPMTSWVASGGTPLYDAVGDLIELFKSMPDYSNPNVSFLMMITTDGGENGSKKYNENSLRREIESLNQDGRWTIVFRVPKGYANRMTSLGVPAGNVQEWDTTSEGMARSTVQTTAAMDSFYSSRSAGQKSSGVFYANATAVSANLVKSTLEDISAQVSLWSVMPEENGAEIKPFAEKRLGGQLLKGAAFYQLTKTEARVQEKKLIIIRDKKSGHVYFGPAARVMIGLPTLGTCRLHPGDHGNYDLFIQSTSINRKLIAGTAVIYWPKAGVPFKPEDTAYLNGPVVGIKPAPVQATGGVMPIAQVKPTNKPTPSPLQKPRKKVTTKNGNKVKYFPTRVAARAEGIAQDAGVNAPNGKRWFIYV